jgi:hypothetical protein
VSLAQTLQRLSPPYLIRRRGVDSPGEPAALINEEGIEASPIDGVDGEGDSDDDDAEEGQEGPIGVIGVKPRGLSAQEEADLMETFS